MTIDTTYNTIFSKIFYYISLPPTQKWTSQKQYIQNCLFSTPSMKERKFFFILNSYFLFYRPL